MQPKEIVNTNKKQAKWCQNNGSHKNSDQTDTKTLTESGKNGYHRKNKSGYKKNNKKTLYYGNFCQVYYHKLLPLFKKFLWYWDAFWLKPNPLIVINCLIMPIIMAYTYPWSAVPHLIVIQTMLLLACPVSPVIIAAILDRFNISCKHDDLLVLLSPFILLYIFYLVGKP